MEERTGRTETNHHRKKNYRKKAQPERSRITYKDPPKKMHHNINSSIELIDILHEDVSDRFGFVF